MKSKILTILIIICAGFFISCDNPLSSIDSNDVIITGSLSSSESTIGETGTVSFSFKAVSDDIKNLTSSAQEENSRLFFFINTYEINIKDSNGDVLGTFSGSSSSMFGSAVIASVANIPYGSGYSAEVKVYNPDVSSIEPVLLGTSSDFDLGRENVSVSVYLFPFNAVSLTDGYSEDIELVTCVYDYQDSHDFASTGGEYWYSVTPEAFPVTFTMTPDSESAPYFIAWDSDGISSDGSTDDYVLTGQYGDQVVVTALGMDIGKTYYIGVVLFSEVKESHELLFEFDNGTPFPGDVYEPNNGYDDAYEITAGTDYFPNFNYTGDYDYYKIDISEGSTYMIDPAPYGTASSSLYVFLLDEVEEYISSVSQSDTDGDGYQESGYLATYTGEMRIGFYGTFGDYSFTVIENTHPTASFTYTPSPAETDMPVLFDGTSSTDADDTIVSWIWDFGDGSSDSGESVSHIYTEVSEYLVSLTCTDSAGATSTTLQKVVVNSVSNYAPSADAGPDQNLDTDVDGTVVYLDGSGSTDTLPGTIAGYNWMFYSYPEGCWSPDFSLYGSNTVSAYFDIDDVGGDPDLNGELEYELLLIVTDDGGATSFDFVTINVTGSGSLNIIVE